MKIIWNLISIALFVIYCDMGMQTSFSEGERYAMELSIRSSAFEEGELIPKKYTCDGEDVSPPLSWTQLPKETKSAVLICDDPDAPMGTWVHWVLFGLSPDTLGLPEGIPHDKEILCGAKHGLNDFRKYGYGGPCPPEGTHRYFFKLYAVNIHIDLNAGATKNEVLNAIEGHILAEGKLMGRYRR
ncbi:MAG: YbhB/YbcL family Raf kinase inhibitor-like protein [Candidatus Scalindua sp.]|nr:YbhB/YbcL family Raf kinase inhibitor-like protein [Candidatus Scalindua sp.]MCR4343495.1 YbhB/YbcL family Raf kinase inhibitor-like protein [Candidatus Scalindua sp.]